MGFPDKGASIFRYAFTAALRILDRRLGAPGVFAVLSLCAMSEVREVKEQSMLNYVRDVIKKAMEDSEFKENLTPRWMVGSVVVGVVAAVTITSAISKGYRPDIQKDLLD